MSQRRADLMMSKLANQRCLTPMSKLQQLQLKCYIVVP
jgi:hypothetical protein